ncbi:MAG: MXAN_5187 C-terminal domain-containing protein [Myxococcota bacterium]
MLVRDHSVAGAIRDADQRQCGEQTKDVAFERFQKKLKKNRAKLIDKYNCKTVRFQVYEKDGKAALKATPVRAR